MSPVLGQSEKGISIRGIGSVDREYCISMYYYYNIQYCIFSSFHFFIFSFFLDYFGQFTIIIYQELILQGVGSRENLFWQFYNLYEDTTTVIFLHSNIGITRISNYSMFQLFQTTTIFFSVFHHYYIYIQTDCLLKIPVKNVGKKVTGFG